ncbi:lipocalin family protein [Paenirhodobacter populi]|uniref:lipocalin family protein n=1 Tax=Paenirhodobacter populi TaxID=2306993 RepID=UPI000FE37EA9|nr:lipocalin family protein [Sinirhodobacter populi]RWR09423.1 lipocalin [Sinirhodobacter populi]
MRRLIWAAVLALAACGQKPAPEPVALRDPKGWISSAVLFDPARFAGTWYVAASGVPGCAGALQDWVQDGQGWRLSGTDCSGGRATTASGRVALTGPGARFTPDSAFGRKPVWVLWMDQDYRVAVLGTPSGHFGMVLSRSLPPRGDLMNAAREVLDFNGYDVRRITR